MMAVTALVTGLLAALVFRAPLQGASGVVFMFILLGSFTNTRQGDIPLTFILVVLLFLVREVYNAVAVKDNIAQFAHIAGGVCGGMFGFVATRSKRRALQGPGAGAALPGAREQPAPDLALPPDEAGRKKGGS
jgi:membrane associated rhomboid family serine protease